MPTEWCNLSKKGKIIQGEIENQKSPKDVSKFWQGCSISLTTRRVPFIFTWSFFLYHFPNKYSNPCQQNRLLRFRYGVSASFCRDLTNDGHPSLFSTPPCLPSLPQIEYLVQNGHHFPVNSSIFSSSTLHVIIKVCLFQAANSWELHSLDARVSVQFTLTARLSSWRFLALLTWFPAHTHKVQNKSLVTVNRLIANSL